MDNTVEDKDGPDSDAFLKAVEALATGFGIKCYIVAVAVPYGADERATIISAARLSYDSDLPAKLSEDMIDSCLEDAVEVKLEALGSTLTVAEGFRALADNCSI